MENFNIDIRQSKKWKDFHKWFYKSQIYHKLVTSDPANFSFGANFSNFPFEFQSGVFIKYIEEELKYRYSLVYLHDDKKYLISIPNVRISTKYWHSTPFNTLEELILYTFNG